MSVSSLSEKLLFSLSKPKKRVRPMSDRLRIQAGLSEPPPGFDPKGREASFHGKVAPFKEYSVEELSHSEKPKGFKRFFGNNSHGLPRGTMKSKKSVF